MPTPPPAHSVVYTPMGRREGRPPHLIRLAILSLDQSSHDYHIPPLPLTGAPQWVCFLKSGHSCPPQFPDSKWGKICINEIWVCQNILWISNLVWFAGFGQINRLIKCIANIFLMFIWVENRIPLSLVSNLSISIQTKYIQRATYMFHTI